MKFIAIVALLLAGLANYQVYETRERTNAAFSERDEVLKVVAKAIELLSTK